MAGLLNIIIGILLMLFGIFMAFLFPGTREHQGASFSKIGVVIGLISFFIGLVLIVF